MGATLLSRAGRGTAVALAVLAVLPAAGCRRSSPSPVPARDAAFSLAAVSRVEVAFSWRFELPRHLRYWTPINVERFEREGNVAVVESPSEDPQLIRRASIDAESVDTIRVAMAGLESGDVKLYWARAGAPLSEERQITLLAATGDAEGGMKLFDFAVGSHPEWTGEIRLLRLDPTSVPGSRLRLLRIEGLRHRIDEELLATEAEELHKVELDSEIREALLMPAGKRHEQTLEVPDEAVLHFGYGLIESAAKPARSAAPRLSVRVSAEGDRESTVFSTELAPARPGSSSSWRDVEVDLAAYAGKKIRLRFETEAAAATGVPVVSIPGVGSRLPIGPPNVVLISIDTLRADRLSLYGYPEPTTPHIDAWARRHGVAFRSAVAAAPWTLSSHVSLFTGLDSLRHGVNYPTTPAPSGLLTWAELLKRQGYATLALTGGAYLHPRFGFLQGFDRYRYWPDPGRPDKELESHMGQALEWLDGHADRPFFLFFHTYEVHSPFYPREPFFSMLGGRREQLGGPSLRIKPLETGVDEGFLNLRRLVWFDEAAGRETPFDDRQAPLLPVLYDGGVAYADAQIGLLLERLEKMPRPTLVVLTSDHGESLGEHGLVAHGNLYDDNLLVPLIVSYPGRLAGGQWIDRQVRSVDVLPTVLDLLGIEIPPALDGISLVPLIEGRAEGEAPPAWSLAAWSSYGLAVRVGNARKYIYKTSPWPAVAGRDQFFALDADPGEEDNLLSTAPAELRARAREYLARRSAGLRIQVTNSGAVTFRAGLSGPAALEIRLKALEPPCADVSWSEGGTIDLVVPPACDFALILEGDRRQALSVTAAVVEAPAARDASSTVELDPVAIEAPRALGFDGERWRFETTPAVPEVGLAFSWKEPEVALDAGPPASDLNLENQLRALGYIN